MRSFEPDVVHFWLGRAAGFAQSKWREINLGWHGGRHRPERFKNCAWHAVAAPDLSAYLQKHGVDESHIAMLAPFAPVDAPKPMTRGMLATPDNMVLMIAVGVIGERWEIVIEALARSEDIHLWHFDAPHPRARDLAQKLGVTPRLHRAEGAGPRVNLIAAADIALCLPNGDALDRGMIEAWALRKPVITLGANSLAQDGADALMLSRKDGQGLADLIKRITDDASLAARLGENGQRAYRARFTKTAFVRNAMQIYERVRAARVKRDAFEPVTAN